jgi:hypothetical protein
MSYDSKLIHPEIVKGQRVKSRKSRIHWVEFPKPPKKDKGLWIAFIDTHVKPLLEQSPIQWNVNAPPTYHTTFFTSSLDDNLYQHTDEGYRIYSPKPAKRRPKVLTFQNTAEDTSLSERIINSLSPVEVHHRSNDIQVLCAS